MDGSATPFLPWAKDFFLKRNEAEARAEEEHRHESGERGAFSRQSGQQAHRDQETERVFHVAELGEHLLLDVPHADVVVQPVDDVEVAAQVIQPDLHVETLRILGRPELDFPQRQEIARDHRERGDG